MLIYIIVFSFSVFLMAISKKTKSNLIRKAIIGISLLIPSIVAGVRDYSIGTDIYTYGNTWFAYAVNSDNFFKYVQYAMWSGFGFGYATLNFIVSRFTNNPHWFYFWLNFFANILVYSGLKKNKDICDIPLGMYIYYCVFWGIFLNALRQSLALVIVFWGFYYLRNNKFLKYIITVIIAMLFHSTAIVALFAYFVHIAINGKGKLKIGLLIISMSSIAILFFWNILGALNRLGVLPYRYAEYLKKSAIGGGAIIRIFFYGMICVALYILVKKKADAYLLNSYRIFAVYSLLLSSLAFRDAQSVRIAHYYDMYIIYSIPFVWKNARVDSESKKLMYLLLYGVFIVYFIYIFGIRQSDQICPYVFMRM